MDLPLELAKIRDEIRRYAIEYGLDFFETIFEVLDFDQLNEVAAYGGFPNRYPHWRFGMEYEELSKGYTYGLQKIYEMVINNDPSYAYLLESNNLVDQKIVIAHVYAHVDFFKNNFWFSKTNRKMMDEMANHGIQIRKIADKYGIEKVENFIDICLSLENLIDHHSPFMGDGKDKNVENDKDSSLEVKKLKSKDYMDEYINPPEFLEKQKKKLEEEKAKQKKYPETEQKDILLFLIENAPLQNWENIILSIIREESYYFAPQGQTKILNEGWASYWHSKIMTEKVLSSSEVIDYADHHSGTLRMGPGSLNPYKIGLELLRDIEDRWNKGKFGKEYDECDDIIAKKNWDKKLGLGREKIFEVRKIYNDVSFIDAFLTEEFCERFKLFTYRFNRSTGMYEIADRDYKKIKEKLLFSLTNFGQPFIFVEDANFENKGELYLKHKHEGVDLRIDYALDTIKNIYHIWKRPVHLETIVDEKGKLFSFDGKNHTEKDINIKK